MIKNISKPVHAKQLTPKKAECIAILDGDQSYSTSVHVASFMKALENSKDQITEEEWFKKRLYFLPGNTWPEKWIIEQLNALDTQSLASLFKCSNDELDTYIKEALTAEKHNELFNLSKNLSLELEYVKGTVTSWLSSAVEDEFSNIIEAIKNHLD